MAHRHKRKSVAARRVEGRVQLTSLRLVPLRSLFWGLCASSIVCALPPSSVRSLRLSSHVLSLRVESPRWVLPENAGQALTPLGEERARPYGCRAHSTRSLGPA